MTQTKKHNVSLHDLTLFPLGLDATVPVGFQEAGPVTVQLAGIAAALAGAGIPLRPPKSTDTPGLLIAECLDAELTRVSTPELRVAACLGVHLGYDEDYLYTLEDDGTDEEEALKDDELIVAAYPVSRRTISFSAMRALLDPYTGPLGLSVPLGLALHVACEQALGAALRICGPVGAMDMRSFDGMEDPDEEEDSIRYDLARDRLQATSQHTGKKTVAQDNQDLHKLARAVTDKELADHIQKSGLLTLRRMYDHYGFRHLPERHNVTTEQLRRILDHTQKCGLDPRTARAVRRWIIELERLQVVDQDVYAQIKALHHVGNPMRRTVYGLREPTIVLDILGPGQHPDSGFVGGLDERIQERCHAEMQSCNPDVPLTAVCLTADNAGAVLAMCRALGELERGACALFEDISRWSELTLAQLRTGDRAETSAGISPEAQAA